MKKRKIILMILALLLILGLSSCNKKNPGNVLNEQFIKDNIEDNDYNDDSIIDYSNVSVNAKSFDYDRIIKSYSNLGLVVVENNYSRVGFYSLQYNKYIVNPRFVNEWLTYEVNTSSYVDYVLTIDYDCHTYIYDSLGNELYNGEEDDISVSHTMVNGILYCTLTYNDSYYPEYSYFKYNKNGSVQSVSSIEYYKYDDEDEDEITEFPFGTLYFDMVSLSEFGLDYYISLNNNLLTVYNSNKIYKFTTHIPSEIEGVAVITNKLYYQVTNILPDDSNEYDYSIANAKYSLTTYSLSLSDGTQKKEKLDYIILDSKPDNKKSSVEKFSHLKIQRIDDERTLGFVEEYIVDSNGNFRDDVTNMELESFIAVGDNLYNTKTKILYNSQLKVISYLNNINPVYYEEGYFIGNLNGSYGILDTNGLVVCEFIYDSITPTFVNDCVIGYKNGEYYRINLNYNDHDLLGKYNEVTKINNYLYIVEGESYYYFEGIDEEISRQYKSYNCTYSFSYKTLSSLYSKDNICVTVTSKYADTLDYNEIRYYLFKYNEYPNDSSFTSHGDTNSSYPAYGTSVDDAINLNVEEENYYYYLSGQNKFVYSFTPQNIGYYTIDSCYGELSISVVDSEGNQISLNYNYDIHIQHF